MLLDGHCHKPLAFQNLASIGNLRTTIDHDQLNQNAYFLNLQNGTIDLSTGELREHRQADSITQIANVTFDPKAQCPKWKAFIDLIVDEDDEAKRYIQALLRYSCSGDVGEHMEIAEIIHLFGKGTSFISANQSFG